MRTKLILEFNPQEMELYNTTGVCKTLDHTHCVPPRRWQIIVARISREEEEA